MSRPHIGTQDNSRQLNIDDEDSDAIKSKALWEALVHLKKDWRLSDEQIGKYLHVAKTTINNWINKKAVPYSTLWTSNDTERLVHLIAIDRNLTSFFRNTEAKSSWIHSINIDLGESPHRLIEGSFENLLRVRKYLDVMRGRGA